MTDVLRSSLEQAREEVLSIGDSAVVAFNGRCSLTDDDCEGAHYSACHGTLPDPQCSQDDIYVTACANSTCGVLQDFSTSVVQIPAVYLNGTNSTGIVDYNVIDENVIETVCYTSDLDDALLEASENVGSTSGVSPVTTYYGSWNGVMRVFPGSGYNEECGDYDPRIRSWYAGASSGPSDVVIVVDISYSMEEEGRLDLAKSAVATVLETMDSFTFVNIVVFAGTARVLTSAIAGETLLSATDENKQLLVDLLSEEDFASYTNYEAGLVKAFDVFDNSRIYTERYSGCKAAIIFLSDGVPNLGEGDAAGLAQLVEERNGDYDARLFTFALGPTADEFILRSLACQTRGIFQAIEDGGDLEYAMASYYRYYTYGLSYSRDYTTNTGLYNLTGGSLGFSVSSPSYDTDSSPPTFLGVAGMDFTAQSFLDEGYSLCEIEAALDGEGGTCPFFNLTECEIEQFRASISDNSTCDVTNCVISDSSIDPEPCMQGFPDNLWADVGGAGSSTYLDRQCCNHEAVCEAEADTNDDSLLLISIVATSSVLIFCCLMWFFVWFFRIRGRKEDELESPPRRSARAVTGSRMNSQVTTVEGLPSSTGLNFS